MGGGPLVSAPSATSCDTLGHGEASGWARPSTEWQALRSRKHSVELSAPQTGTDDGSQERSDPNPMIEVQLRKLAALPASARAPVPACEAARLLTVERLCTGRKQNTHLDTITKLVLSLSLRLLSLRAFCLLKSWSGVCHNYCCKASWELQVLGTICPRKILWAMQSW